MIIRYVKLENILSHERSEVEFPDGIVAIVGPNGAGKSSIIDSIYLALFSDVRPDIRGGRKEFIVMRGRSRGEVVVVFEVEGVRYSVVRELSSSERSSAGLYIINGSDRRLRASGVPNVLSELSRIMGVPTAKDLRNMVRSTIIALQDELTEIIEITEAERKEWILSLLGLSYLEKALDAVKSVVSEKERLKGELSIERRNLVESRGRYDRLLNIKSTIANDIKKVEGELRELQLRRDEISSKLAITSKCISLANYLRMLIIRKRVEELEFREATLRVIDEWDPNRYTHLTTELGREVSRLNSVDSEFRKLLNEASVEFGRPLTTVDELSNLLNELKAKEEELSRSIEYNKALSELYTAYLKRFESSSRCPICGSLINNPKLIKEHLSSERLRLMKLINELEGGRASLRSRIKFAEARVAKLNEISAMRSLIEGRVRELESSVNLLRDKAVKLCNSLPGDVVGNFKSVDECVNKLNELKKELDDVRAELSVLRSKFRDVGIELPSHLSVDGVKGELTNLLRQVGIELGSDLNEVSIDELVGRLLNLQKSLNNDLNTLNNSITDKERVKGSLLGQYERVESDISELSVKIRESEERVKELERRVKVLEVVGSFSSKYLGKDGLIAKELTKTARAELERRTNRILLKLGLRPIEIGDDFNIFINVLGDRLPVKNASGGEKVGIAIAMRLALAELIMGRSPTTLILDEPTVYLDDERRRCIFNIISELARSLKQVIVVTHDEAVIDIANKVIRVENRGGISVVY